MTEACLDSKKPNPEDIESEVEHREILTEEAAVKSSGNDEETASNCRATRRTEGSHPRRL
jgi:hypothetical protein